ncbi:hypothetical protein [Streptomyces sp. NPDC056921]|uniref:hypothetical protein n=1 Tax=Streptomyces sp. NPDC056921 TaxID=3345966 RepID=UPI00362510C6
MIFATALGNLAPYVFAKASIAFSAWPRPILVRAGLACFAFLVCNPVAALVLGELFALSFIVGFGLRRRARRSVRGGVFDKSMVGF